MHLIVFVFVELNFIIEYNKGENRACCKYTEKFKKHSSKGERERERERERVVS